MLLVFMLCCVLAGAQFLGTKTPYPAPPANYTPPPVGYAPVFINYVGRHGARYMTKPGTEQQVMRLLNAAAGQRGLTQTGARVQKMVELLYKTEQGHYENITLLGEAEQQAIGQRMLQLYPTVFNGRGLGIEATYKIRTQQSAEAFLKAFRKYKGPKHFTKRPDSADAILRFYDLSPAYDKYTQSSDLQAAFDSLDGDARTIATVSAVCRRLFTADFIAKMKPVEALGFTNNLYDLYTIQFSLGKETNHGTDLGAAFDNNDLTWLDFVAGAHDFLEKGPGRDSLGIQVKVAAPMLVEFIHTTDIALKQGRPDAMLRFTHAEALSPFAALLGIPQASTAATTIFDYNRQWQACNVIPLSANIQWIVYSNGYDNLVKILMNEREVMLPLPGTRGPYYSWVALREYCIGRLRSVGAGVNDDVLGYLHNLK